MIIEIVEIFFGGVILLIASIFAFIPLLVLFLYKSFIIWIASFSPELIPINPCDVLMALGDSSVINGVNIGCVVQLDGVLSLEEVRALFARKFCNSENKPRPEYVRFQCCIVDFMGYAFYKKVSNFALNQQISEIQLKDDDSLEEAMSTFVHKKYDKDQPCWEMLVVQNGNSGKSCLAFKIHHGVADGYSVRHVLDCLAETKSSYIVKDWEENVLQNTAQILRSFCHISKTKWNPENDVLVDITQNNLAPLRLGFGHLDLDKMKHIRKIAKVQFFSVLTAVVASSIAKHVKKKKGRFSNMGNNQIGFGVSLPLPRHPAAVRDTLCNHLTLGTVSVSVDEKISPLVRLRSVDGNLKQYFRLGLHKHVHWITLPCTWLLPTKLLVWATRHVATVPVTATMMMGERYRLLGREVERLHPLSSLPNLPTNVHFVICSATHGSKFDIMVGAVRHHFKDQEELNDFSERVLQQELNELYKVVVDESRNLHLQ